MSEGMKHDEDKPKLELLPPCYWDASDPSRDLVDWFYRRREFPAWPEFFCGGGSFAGGDAVPVLAFDADKYGRFNWLQGMRWSRLVGAFLRHTHAWDVAQGKWTRAALVATDEESGLPHSAHAACCYWFLAEYVASGIGEDDRPPALPQTTPELVYQATPPDTRGR